MDEKSVIEKLEAEKRALENKCESLAKIIEISSTKPSAGAGSENVKDISNELENLKKGIKSIKKHLKELNTNNPKIKELADILDSKMKDLEKISSLDERLKKIEESIAKPAAESGESKAGNIFGGFGDVKKRGEQLKKIEEFKNVFTEFKDSVDTRLTSLETRLEELNMKLTPGTLKNLEHFVASESKIIDEVVPMKVKEEIDKILSSFSFEIENLTNTIRFLTKDIEKSNKSLKRFVNWVKRMDEKIKSMESVLSQIQKDIITKE